MSRTSIDGSTDARKPLLAKGVSKIYNNNDASEESVTAVDNMSFSVDQNEFTVLIGPSGCGKTTMLHIFAGLVPPTSGDILSMGDPIEGPSTNRAVVFQHFNLFPWRTIRENVAFGLEMEDVPAEERNSVASRYIDMVGLSGYGDNYPGQLSGGMQQRVGLARALAVDPDVLLMDEPFGALDAQTRQTMQRELLRIWEQDKKTILFVTHDIDEAILLGDRVVVMGRDPHNVQADIEIPFQRPRYDREIETSTEFQDIKQRLWQKLQSISGQEDSDG